MRSFVSMVAKWARIPAPHREHSVRLVLTLAIVATGLAGRSAVDKALALRGGAELVALWAQLSTLMEMVAGVALAGVGAGLSVLVARTPLQERQYLFLRRALYLGLVVALPVALLVGAAGWRLSGLLGGAALSPMSIALAALVGWVAVAPGLVNSFWLGQQRRGLMLGLATWLAAITLTASLVAPAAFLLESLVVSQAAAAAALLLLARPADVPRREEDRTLERYILPGVMIGILSPMSMVLARSAVGESLTWHDSGVLQALWRISDWICGIASGVLGVLYFPRFAAAHANGALRPVMRESVGAVLFPSAALFIVLYVLHRPLLALLYDDSFQAPATAVALLFAGSLVRIASWIALYALYAALRTRAIAFGELLSLPLFALLVILAGGHLSLELLGALWLASFLAYAAFNFWALREAVG
jgi:O-antigen/teichoic acid export membrane protein